MTMLVAGALLITVWLLGVLLYINYFSETSRAGGGVIEAVAWVSLGGGLSLVLTGGLGVLRLSVVRHRG